MSSLISPGVQITAPTYLSSVHTKIVKTYPIVNPTNSQTSTPTTPTEPVDEPTFYHYKNTDLSVIGNITVSVHYTLSTIYQDRSGQHLIALLYENDPTGAVTVKSVCTATSSNGGLTWQYNYANKLVSNENISSFLNVQYQLPYINIKFTSLTDTEIANGVVPIAFAQITKNAFSDTIFMYSTDYGVTWNHTPAVTFNGYVDEILDMDPTYYNGHTYLYVFGWNSINGNNPPANNYISVLTDCTTWSDSTPSSGLMGFVDLYGFALQACGRYLFISAYSTIYDTVLKTETYVSSNTYNFRTSTDVLIKINNCLYANWYSTNTYILKKFDPATVTQTDVITIHPPVVSSIDDLFNIGNKYLVVYLNNLYYIYDVQTLTSYTLTAMINPRPYSTFNLSNGILDIYKMSGNLYHESYTLSNGIRTINDATIENVSLINRETTNTEICTYTNALAGFKNKKAYSSSTISKLNAINQYPLFELGYVEFSDYGKTWDIKIPEIADVSTGVYLYEYMYPAILNDKIITTIPEYNPAELVSEISIENDTLSMDSYTTIAPNKNYSWSGQQILSSNSDNTETCYLNTSMTSQDSFTTWTFEFTVIQHNASEINTTTPYSTQVSFPEDINGPYGTLAYNDGVAHVLMPGHAMWYFSYDTKTNQTSTPISLSGDYLVGYINDAGAFGDFVAYNSVFWDPNNDDYPSSLLMIMHLSTGTVSQLVVDSCSYAGGWGSYAGSGHMAGNYYYVGCTQYVHKVDLTTGLIVKTYDTEIDPNNDYVQCVVGDSTGNHVLAITTPI